MANADRPNGMLPYRHLTGGEIRTTKYNLDASNGDLITKGDPVIREGDGFIARGAAGGTFLGVAAGFIHTDADGNEKYVDQIPATKTNFTGLKVLVWDDPDILFQIQADGTTAVTDRFATFPIVIAAGDTDRKLSNCELDSTGGAGDELKIIDKVDITNNDWGANVNLIVLINDHAYRAVKAGV